MSRCSVCGREFPEGRLLRCYDCGKAYCPECAEKNPTIKELGVARTARRSSKPRRTTGVGVRKRSGKENFLAFL